MKFLLHAIIYIALSLQNAHATEADNVIGKFSSADLTGWKEQTIFGSNKSTYSFVQDNGRTVLQGKSTDAASGLMYKIDIDPKTSPIIKWSWKIEHVIKKGNEKTKEGHDFPVRLYVVFPRGFFSSHRAIEYVWGNALLRGESLKSPFSKNAIMIAVDSGNELAGHWTFHKRNYYDDYRVAFGEEPPRVGAIAVMTDSDNTHESSLGYYGDIAFVSVAAKTDEQKLLNGKTKEGPPKEAPSKDQKPKEQPAITGPPPPQSLPLPANKSQ